LTLRTLVLALALVPGITHAQVELTGTYVRYLAVSGDGTMICMSGACMGHSMQYRETETSTASCDLYSRGTVREAFTVEATGASEVTFTNSANGTDAFTTVSPVAIAGRTITWSGAASSAGVSLRVDQVFSFEPEDNHVRLAVTITNTGASALTNVYYLRNGDPDHAACSIGSTHATYNDVLRQPPAVDSALTTARAGNPGSVLVVGLGAHDPRARAHNGGFTNIDPSAEWSAPRDGAGAQNDEAVDLVFREPSLAAGASTTFEMYWVWGTSEAQVEERFDELRFPSGPCAGSAEGAICSVGAATGSCRAGRCCTGCFDGTRCRLGVTESACGVGGGSCASCADSDPCSRDVCSLGACSHPPSAMGTVCDDSLFCTSSDVCDGAGRCAGTTMACDDREDCTVDTCDEALDRCSTTPRADGATCTASSRGGICGSGRCCTGCFDGTVCLAGATSTACGQGGGSCRSCSDGDPCTSDVCTSGACTNPAAPTTTPCDDGLFCTSTDRCDGAGACVGGGGARCDDGASCTMDVCDEDLNMCRHSHASGCLIGGGCVPEGALNPTYPCQVCDPARDRDDWSPLAAGTECGASHCALGRISVRTCDAGGECIVMPPSDCPSGSCSDGEMCGATCVAGGCALGSYCDRDTDRCAPQVLAGAACEDTEECRPGLTCTDGVCCISACDGACEMCNARGSCLPVPAGTDPDGECHPGDVCGGDGFCVPGVDGEVAIDGGMIDAGRDDEGDAGMTRIDAGMIDAGLMDAGMIVEEGGCSCRASHRSPPHFFLALAPLFVWLARRRRSCSPRSHDEG
jgi:hypothetical protein